MSDFASPADLIAEIRDLRSRLSALERTRKVPQFTTTTRPAAADAKGLIIFNTTTNTFQGSDGATWLTL